jgi:small-conductance mechanosensitive channel
MTIQLPPVASPEVPPPPILRQTATFDERWAAWQAKGAVHDRAVRRKMAIAAPILIILTAVVIYVYTLFGR